MNIPSLSEINFSSNQQYVTWGNLSGSALAFAVGQLSNVMQRPIILITESSQLANQCLREIPLFQDPSRETLAFSDWETLPYDQFSPHQDIISYRLLALSRLPRMQHGVMVVPMTSLVNKIAPPSFLSHHTIDFKVGDKISMENFRLNLVNSGYYAVSSVMSHGEFAIRGSIIDLFPMGLDSPIRIDLFDDEIESLRYFDPSTQRSTEKMDSILLLPAREFPLDEDAISRFRKNWRAQFEGDPSKSVVYQNISVGLSAGGIEYYLPFFFEECVSLIDYFPKNALIIRSGDLQKSLEMYFDEIKERYEQYRHDIYRPILPPQKLYHTMDSLFGQLKQFQFIQAQMSTSILARQAKQEATIENSLSIGELPDLTMDAKSEAPLGKLLAFLNDKKESNILLCAESAGRLDNLNSMLSKADIHAESLGSLRDFLSQPVKLGICVAPLERGFELIDLGIVIISESMLYGQKVMQRRRRKATQENDAWFRNLAELEIGAPVVHIDHGIGRYLGLTLLDLGPIQTEYVTLGYAGEDKLYVPVSSLHLISRYSGSDVEHAPLHKLGSETWGKAKQHAAKKVQDVAAQLLEIYAKRAAKPGFRYEKPEDNYERFKAAFLFEETPDQMDAINSIIEDMCSSRPMDRLVCGDVGFGKTEVALRAVFLAVQSGKQVGVLVPTTLLAQQHYQTFKDRFADWPVNIEVLSRFKSKKEQDVVLQKLAANQVDVVIGTHKLIQSDVKFHNLGLLVIDEEHRFGVKQKEKLKSLRSEVDILTLTATPIPRTLNMAMASIRDLSIIATPPARRLSVKTFVAPAGVGIIKEAIQRELLRGGQIYYVHNDVESINRKAQELSEIVPDARIIVAHGQMPERELEKVMLDFYHQRYSILVCTTIIETGIDIPSANTIIIDRADKFGLAQLHQLRGRVGRSHHQAYAYCLTPTHKAMTPDGIRRLKALESLEELGSGFSLSSHDLEIRGAGELLGEEQSGDMQSIGFNLYMELLDKSVKAMQSGKAPIDLENYSTGAEIDLGITAMIPQTYIGDVHVRLVLYKRICACADNDELDSLKIEMIDRFGLLPVETQNLLSLSQLRIKAEPLGIKKIDASEAGGKIAFEKKPSFDPQNAINLIRSAPNVYRITSNNVLTFKLNLKEVELRFKTLHHILDSLHGKKVN